jgi:16S rRNA (guanine966-N2)-methyltransferase
MASVPITDRQFCSMASNEVRIIGGKWRGRKLVFPAAAGLRPTLGRVRETLFNWLREDVIDSRCLDLFAGSGALGFEALSRGAASVTLVDSNRRVAQGLRDNASRLAADGAAVVCDRAERVLRRGGPPWDLIFLDPPFASASQGDMLELITAAGALAEGGLIYVEAARRAPEDLRGFVAVRQGSAGDTRFGLLAYP